MMRAWWARVGRHACVARIGLNPAVAVAFRSVPGHSACRFAWQTPAGLSARHGSNEAGGGGGSDEPVYIQPHQISTTNVWGSSVSRGAGARTWSGHESDDIDVSYNSRRRLVKQPAEPRDADSASTVDVVPPYDSDGLGERARLAFTTLDVTAEQLSRGHRIIVCCPVHALGSLPPHWARLNCLQGFKKYLRKLGYPPFSETKLGFSITHHSHKRAFANHLFSVHAAPIARAYRRRRRFVRRVGSCSNSAHLCVEEQPSPSPWQRCGCTSARHPGGHCTATSQSDGSRPRPGLFSPYMLDGVRFVCVVSPVPHPCNAQHCDACRCRLCLPHHIEAARVRSTVDRAASPDLPGLVRNATGHKP